MSKDSSSPDEIMSLPISDLLIPDDLLGRYSSPGMKNAQGEYSGRIVTSPVSGGKGLQECTLVFDDGESVLISYRPVPAYFEFERKRVLVRGEMHNPARAHPNRQAVMGWHLDITEIRLADGEVPYDPTPTSLPPPQRVDSLAALSACSDQYFRIVGRLVSGTSKGPHRANLQLELSDGLLLIPSVTLVHPGSFSVRSLLMRSENSDAVRTPRPEENALDFGDTITIIGTRFSGKVSGMSACPGDVEFCGCGLQAAARGQSKKSIPS